MQASTIYRFPEQKVIEEYLDNHPSTKSHSKEWKVHETVAKFFAETTKNEEGIFFDFW